MARLNIVVAVFVWLLFIQLVMTGGRPERESLGYMGGWPKDEDDL
ncbi:hypothetical protein [Paenibacillus alkalitolerans]|nr:hypothetical protein [Paenibacillus alkalitolerans]